MAVASPTECLGCSCQPKNTDMTQHFDDFFFDNEACSWERKSRGKEKVEGKEKGVAGKGDAGR